MSLSKSKSRTFVKAPFRDYYRKGHPRNRKQTCGGVRLRLHKPLAALSRPALFNSAVFGSGLPLLHTSSYSFYPPRRDGSPSRAYLPRESNPHPLTWVRNERRRLDSFGNARCQISRWSLQNVETLHQSHRRMASRQPSALDINTLSSSDALSHYKDSVSNCSPLAHPSEKKTTTRCDQVLMWSRRSRDCSVC
jgi:hypothetical protein